MSSETPTPDARARRVWSLGSYPDVAPTFLEMAARLVESVGQIADDTVLDVGCGTGNVAVTAARRGARATGLDIVPAMLEEARTNARIAGVEGIDWREGSATALPFADDAFDVTLSCLGHMFAEPPDAAGRELLRVTRSGGPIAFTSWTPEGPVPAMGAVLADYLPTEPDPSPPPFLWGDADVVRERLGDGVADLRFEPGTVRTPVLSPAHYWEKATTESGMFIAALEVVDPADLPALREAMLETIEGFFEDDRNAVPMPYLRTTARVA